MLAIENISTLKIILILLGVLTLSGVFSKHLPATGGGVRPATDISRLALDYALKQEGKPYGWGARGPDRYDCSGLVIASYRQAYPSIKFKNGSKTSKDATADMLYRYNVAYLRTNEIKPGDLVFTTTSSSRITHVGLFVRWINELEFQFISVSSSKRKVALVTWPIHGKIGNEWFVGAGRLIIQ